MLRKISLFLLLLVSLVAFTACASSSSTTEDVDKGTPETGTQEQANVADQTIFSPPVEDGNIAGVWSTEADELKVDRYFYGDGKLVTMIQDPEEETWVIFSLWNSTDNTNFTVENQKAYKYNEETGQWEETEPSVETVKSMTKTGDNSLITDEVLPNGNQVQLDFKRQDAKITDWPNQVQITELINEFLIH